MLNANRSKARARSKAKSRARAVAKNTAKNTDARHGRRFSARNRLASTIDRQYDLRDLGDRSTD